MEALEGTPLVHPAATRRSGNPRALVRRRIGPRAFLVALLVALTGAISPAAASAALPSLGSASAPVARVASVPSRALAGVPAVRVRVPTRAVPAAAKRPIARTLSRITTAATRRSAALPARPAAQPTRSAPTIAHNPARAAPVRQASPQSVVRNAVRGAGETVRKGRSELAGKVAEPVRSLEPVGGLVRRTSSLAAPLLQPVTTGLLAPVTTGLLRPLTRLLPSTPTALLRPISTSPLGPLATRLLPPAAARLIRPAPTGGGVWQGIPFGIAAATGPLGGYSRAPSVTAAAGHPGTGPAAGAATRTGPASPAPAALPSNAGPVGAGVSARPQAAHDPDYGPGSGLGIGHGAAGSGSGFSFTLLATILGALALAAAASRRLLLPRPTWRPVAIVALLEHPG